MDNPEQKTAKLSIGLPTVIP